MTMARFWMLRARLAYRRQLRLSSKFELDGETQATMRVRWLPPRLPRRSLVSLESR